ncbi:MAG: DUF302 domain-containing protein [Thiogranum sp.]
MHLDQTLFTRRTVAVLVFILMNVVACGPGFEQDPATRYTLHTSKSFDDVLTDLEFAIGEQNFRLTGRNTIGAAITERGEFDLPAATVLHFCNLEYARQILQVAPQYLLHMPCRIAVYQQEGKVTVEARLLPENDPAVRLLSQRVNRILEVIVSNAVE